MLWSPTRETVHRYCAGSQLQWISCNLLAAWVFVTPDVQAQICPETSRNAEDRAPACGVALEREAVQPLQVLHWWKSVSERKAVDLLASRLADENLAWRDSGTGGNAGVAADVILKSRVLAGDAPDVAQINGVTIMEWARLGLLLDIDDAAAAGKWEKRILPEIFDLIQPHRSVVAAPLGIHRINILFYNRRLFAEHGIVPPRDWSEFESTASTLQRKGVTPLAQSGEPWQVATLFETLVLSEGGAEFYRDLFVQRKAYSYADLRLTHALQRLRGLKKWMPAPVPEQPWFETAKLFASGSAAMMVMGDWMKGELNAWGLITDDAFGCSAVPGTAEHHLYDVDTLAMLVKHRARRAAQLKFARIVASSTVQAEYNRLKGSVTVLRNPDFSSMDGCARASWKLFTRGPAARVPSLVHRMAADQVTKNGIIAEVHRFFIDDRVTVADVQHRLAVIAQQHRTKVEK